MTVIIDYGAGNIKSVEKALLALGQEVVITDDADTILGSYFPASARLATRWHSLKKPDWMK